MPCKSIRIVGGGNEFNIRAIFAKGPGITCPLIKPGLEAVSNQRIGLQVIKITDVKLTYLKALSKQQIHIAYALSDSLKLTSLEVKPKFWEIVKSQTKFKVKYKNL